ncbi:MAG TPA: CAP domain-containing protein [Candidatus Acidoferrales bacterium]|nr:CAP domain-containing protein [Candidatus Acidoferrales bacterium]
MGRRLSYILLSFLILTVFSTHTVSAAQQQNIPTFFSFLENYLLAFTSITSYNNKVLAAHTASPTNQPPTHHSQPSPQLTPPPIQQNVSLSDVSSYILNGVNTYRSSLGLSQVHASSQTCNFAATRALEITTSFSHDAFYSRVNNHTIPYSSWSRAVENIAEAPDYKEVVTLWKNSPGHAANMRDNTPYVCIIRNGSYYAYEGMRP